MTVQIIEDKKIWEDFLADVRDKTFLQSWNWGEVEQRMGNKIWRLGVLQNNQIVCVALVVKIRARRGTFLLVRHAPVLKISDSELRDFPKEIFMVLISELKAIAQKEKAAFIRVAPLLEKNEKHLKMLKELGFRNAPMHANAYDATWKLDITPPADELLKQMRKTTRYLIKQAGKNQEIVIEKSDRVEDIAMFNALTREVAARQKFVPFAGTFTKNEFETFANDGQALLFLGRYKGNLACAALVIFWSGIAFYHQAASRSEYAKLSIPYLLQWEAICEAKRRGCRLYDFWGYVDTKQYPNHPWAGPTKFKMGFGGQASEYVKTQDFALSLQYWALALFEALRKIKRRL
ncbi:MAG: hypothetical protein A2748_03675 [Candidatus Wildermuthbacteria bacterium RIFCSPHIGHO2_01_FULL_45_20]|uniref:BioF2-like acetyltransferase domain-containing protein n=1 Tax=Candidatus Wildermuthbacteria bacterium RIFCSPHIGHO2_02_FULL_45_25 TaxID=1802450 RepID=A0A1G2R4I0_9BACT|nr:MAG: hypothetical protein A2748_03675 [Candidatus Wildermuthbacteria bacterium RIFCSPHIGHO2_01_FULL_45_20]OHA67736.1 MAG: hypothetical protein A3C04_00415 [Candidatus Wildermuthbacteria bacterium RIFCSPHIGHO2_02_FULL_45_25]